MWCLDLLEALSVGALVCATTGLLVLAVAKLLSVLQTWKPSIGTFAAGAILFLCVGSFGAVVIERGTSPNSRWKSAEEYANEWEHWKHRPKWQDTTLGVPLTVGGFATAILCGIAAGYQWDCAHKTRSRPRGHSI